MNLLIFGLLIWITVHLFPSLAAETRQSISGKLGEMPYQGLYALCILLGLALIILGWRSTVPSQIYQPIPVLRHVAMLIVVFAFILMVAANFSKTRIKQYIRHPQLTAVFLWGLAHLLANGDSRSLILFSSMGIWSVVSMITINRRDGVWQKPQAVMPLYQEFLMIIIAVVLAAVVVRFHIYIAGVPLIGG